MAPFSWKKEPPQNPGRFTEALFRTCKYRPDFPERSFSDLSTARTSVQGFVHWYNEEHCHSGIRFVTPAQRHLREDPMILSKRCLVYTLAKAGHPERRSGNIRNWSPIGTVWLNPDHDCIEGAPEFLETGNQG